MIKAIIYTSNAGHTKRYAEMSAEKLGIPAYSLKEAKKQVRKKSDVIYMTWIKKGKLVEELSDEDILNIARKINNMPRKALGYKTPLEVFESNLKKKGIDTRFLDIYRIKLPRCLVA